jgi:hypothetical protein
MVSQNKIRWNAKICSHPQLEFLKPGKEYHILTLRLVEFP